MNNKINQDGINKALWAACDTFRGTIGADTYKDFILTMLFLKYISDAGRITTMATRPSTATSPNSSKR